MTPWTEQRPFERRTIDLDAVMLMPVDEFAQVIDDFKRNVLEPVNPLKRPMEYEVCFSLLVAMEKALVALRRIEAGSATPITSRDWSSLCVTISS